MATTPKPGASLRPGDGNATPTARSGALVQEYLLEHLPVYRELHALREEVVMS